MNSRVDILTLGFCNVDYLAIVPHIPLDEKVQIIETIEQPGGSAATAAVTAARLGQRPDSSAGQATIVEVAPSPTSSDARE